MNFKPGDRLAPICDKWTYCNKYFLKKGQAVTVAKGTFEFMGEKAIILTDMPEAIWYAADFRKLIRPRKSNSVTKRLIKEFEESQIIEIEIFNNEQNSKP